MLRKVAHCMDARVYFYLIETKLGGPFLFVANLVDGGKWVGFTETRCKKYTKENLDHMTEEEAKLYFFMKYS